MVSQKAAALAKHQKAQQSGMMYNNWSHLDTYRLDMLGTEEMKTALSLLQYEHDDAYDSMVEDFVSRGLNIVKLASLSWPIFIRACPLQPRPGVLESSVANNILEAEEVLERIISTMLSKDESSTPMYEHGLIDPEGCIIIQRYIDADASCVIAPGNYIFMGADNDGITASKDCIKVALPHTGDFNTTHDLDALEIDSDKIELEFVSMLNGPEDIRQRSKQSSMYSHSSYITQLRGSEGARPIAPPPKGVTISGTFHGAERIVVTHVHTVSDNSDEQLDMMEQALREGMPSGAVVIHPTGNHLSHHAGQCFKYGVPYIAHDDVNVGEQWTQAASGWVVLDPDGTYEAQPYDATDYIEAFKAGLELGVFNFSRQHGWLSNHFHQFVGGPLYNPQQTAVLAGAFTGWIMNAALAVAVGEMRHIRGSTQNGTYVFYAALHAVYGKDLWKKKTGSDYLSTQRQDFYAMIEENPLDIPSSLRMFDLAIDAYNLDWSSGYGGSAYLKATTTGKECLQAIQAFLALPNADTLKDLTGIANELEHAVHNNGCFFNKFMKVTALDWGTGKEPISLKPNLFFNVYYAAYDVLTMTEYAKSGFSAMNVFNEIDELKEKGMSYLRKNPLGTNDLFPILKASMPALQSGHRHPQGKYGDYAKNLFLPCGVDGCGSCKEHIHYENKKKMDEISNKISLPVSKPTYDMNIPTEPVSKGSVVSALKDLLSALDKNEDEIGAHIWKKIFTELVIEAMTTGNDWDDKELALGAKILTHFSQEDMLLHYKTINDNTNGDE
jgi:hypothetical protein